MAAFTNVCLLTSRLSFPIFQNRLLFPHSLGMKKLTPPAQLHVGFDLHGGFFVAKRWCEESPQFNELGGHRLTCAARFRCRNEVAVRRDSDCISNHTIVLQRVGFVLSSRFFAHATGGSGLPRRGGVRGKSRAWVAFHAGRISTSAAWGDKGGRPLGFVLRTLFGSQLSTRNSQRIVMTGFLTDSMKMGRVSTSVINPKRQRGSLERNSDAQPRIFRGTPSACQTARRACRRASMIRMNYSRTR